MLTINRVLHNNLYLITSFRPRKEGHVADRVNKAALVLYFYFQVYFLVHAELLEIFLETLDLQQFFLSPENFLNYLILRLYLKSVLS